MASIQFNPRARFLLNTGVLLVVLTSLILTPETAFAENNADLAPLPDFDSFVLSVQNGQANVLRGVYISGVFALPILQQPTGYPGYVSTADNQLTQFSMAAEVGNVGLLAHNYLAGRFFPMMQPGQEVRLVYGDGSVEYFTVSQSVSYQALDPYSPYSEFRNLETKITITAEELFRQVYRGDRHITFQTCIESNDNLSWGRLFVIAVPKEIVVETYAFHMRNLLH